MTTPKPERDAAWHAKLAALWLQTEPQLPASQIGKLMGITKNAVVGCVARSNLPRRPSPIVRKNKPHAPELSIRKATLRAIVEPVAAAKPAVVFRRQVEPCAWPERMGPPARYCSADSAPGKPYCAHHCSIAYLKRTG